MLILRKLFLEINLIVHFSVVIITAAESNSGYYAQEVCF